MQQREIKFRAWDKDQKRFRTDLVRDEEGRVWCWNHFVKGYATQMNEECFEWVQFTGLKDKNGKEVWEGNLLGRKDEYVVVEFEDAEFVGRYPHRKKGETNVRYFLTVPGPFMVIGTIYENPELLTSGMEQVRQ